jgi:hypothetical protein
MPKTELFNFSEFQTEKTASWQYKGQLHSVDELRKCIELEKKVREQSRARNDSRKPYQRSMQAADAFDWRFQSYTARESCQYPWKFLNRSAKEIQRSPQSRTSEDQYLSRWDKWAALINEISLRRTYSSRTTTAAAAAALEMAAKAGNLSLRKDSSDHITNDSGFNQNQSGNIQLPNGNNGNNTHTSKVHAANQCGLQNARHLQN